MSAIAAVLPDPGMPALELVPAPVLLGLPPGSVPLEPVRSAIRHYRAGAGRPARGVGRRERLIAAVDRHGDALADEIARLEITHLSDFARGVACLEALHARTADLIAQGRWLRDFPSDVDPQPVPLAVVLDGRRVGVPVVLAALARTAAIDDRLVARARRRPGRRGASASMAALADRNTSTNDVAHAAGVSKTRVYAMPTGTQRVSPQLRSGLTRLLGSDQAAIVLAGIPELPRARRPASAAVRALHAAGVTAEDVAPEFEEFFYLASRFWPRSFSRPYGATALPAPENAIRLRRLTLGSPLDLVAHIPADYWKGGGFILFLLALERRFNMVGRIRTERVDLRARRAERRADEREAELREERAARELEGLRQDDQPFRLLEGEVLPDETDDEQPPGEELA